MFNRILPEFQKYLISRKFVSEKNASYYAYWNSKFLAFSNNKGLSQDLLIRKFLNHLDLSCKKPLPKKAYYLRDGLVKQTSWKQSYYLTKVIKFLMSLN